MIDTGAQALLGRRVFPNPRFRHLSGALQLRDDGVALGNILLQNRDRLVGCCEVGFELGRPPDRICGFSLQGGERPVLLGLFGNQHVDTIAVPRHFGHLLGGAQLGLLQPCAEALRQHGELGTQLIAFRLQAGHC